MYFYVAYQLGIHSAIVFPELAALPDAPKDISIRIRRIDSSERQTPRNCNFAVGEVEGVGSYVFRSGNEIIVEPAPGVEESILRTTLLGPAMAVLLRQRGFAVLHASGVVSNGCAIAFLGQPGWGKSTLAEVFYARGYGVITDDVLAVRIDESYVQVVPGYPSIKLFPDTSAFLGCEASATHRVHSQTEKRAHCVALGFPQGPLPLQRMYVLAGGERNEIEPLQPREVFLELVRNARAVNFLRDRDSLNAHLQQCVRLAKEVPTSRLRRRRVLSDIPDLVELIQEDLAQDN